MTMKPKLELWVLVLLDTSEPKQSGGTSTTNWVLISYAESSAVGRPSAVQWKIQYLESQGSVPKPLPSLWLWRCLASHFLLIFMFSICKIKGVFWHENSLYFPRNGSRWRKVLVRNKNRESVQGPPCWVTWGKGAGQWQQRALKKGYRALEW